MVRLATRKRDGKKVAMKVMTLPKDGKRGSDSARDDIFYEIGLLVGPLLSHYFEHVIVF